mmetsp:Transcript_66573/g.150309  ORF Transcript_66573/g.150309 Transcript_66573/m.150309 type:complete len:231 (-) Transcript_66573:258-950(-)
MRLSRCGASATKGPSNRRSSTTKSSTLGVEGSRMLGVAACPASPGDPKSGHFELATTCIDLARTAEKESTAHRTSKKTARPNLAHRPARPWSSPSANNSPKGPGSPTRGVREGEIQATTIANPEIDTTTTELINAACDGIETYKKRFVMSKDARGKTAKAKAAALKVHQSRALLRPDSLSGSLSNRVARKCVAAALVKSNAAIKSDRSHAARLVSLSEQKWAFSPESTSS